MLVLIVLAAYLLLTWKEPLGDSFTKIFAIQWLFLLSVYLCFQSEFLPLADDFPAAFLAFFIPMVLADCYWRWTRCLIPEPRFPRVIPAGWFFIAAAAVAAVSVCLAARLAATTGVATFMGFRELFSEPASAGRGSIGTGISFPIVCGAWYLARVMGRRVESRLFGALALLLALLTTSKVFLFIALIFALPLGEEGRPSLTARGVVKIALAAVAVFAILHLLLGKVMVVPGEWGVLQGLAATFRVYLLGPVAGLQTVLDGSFDFPGNQMWRFFGDLFPGLVDAPKTGILPWVKVGKWYVNVYTAFSSWYRGAGWLGLPIIGFLIGTLYSLLFKSFRELVFLRIFSIFPLLFIFFQDFFLEAINVWAGFLVVAALVAMTRKGRGAVGRGEA